MKLIPIKFHDLQYPDGINPDLEEIAGHFDKTKIVSKLYDDKKPRDYKFSLHTDPSGGARELGGDFKKKYEEIYKNVVEIKNPKNKNKIPKLWVSKKWAEEFALFIIEILNGAKPKIIEIHPPTTRDISFNTFLDYYEIFKYTLEKNGLKIGEKETMILLENRNGGNNKQFLLTYIWDFLKLSDLIDKRESDLRLILDLPQLLNIHNAKNNKQRMLDILEEINNFKHIVKAIHLWGQYDNYKGKDKAHRGDMNDYFYFYDKNDEDAYKKLKETFFNKIYEIFHDCNHDLYFVPEIIGCKDINKEKEKKEKCKKDKENYLKNIVTDLINAGFRFKEDENPISNMFKNLKKFDENAENYYEPYKKVKLEDLQKYLKKCINDKKNDSILELGFGAGRDIEFLLKEGYKKIYGIEGSEKFLEKVKEELKTNNKEIADNLYYSVLPEINIPENIKFDLIFSTFVWNYLPEIFYEKTIKNITNLLKSNGKVLIAYSLNNNENQEITRYDINEKYLTELFEKYGIRVSEKTEMQGSYNNNDEEILFDFKIFVFKKNN